MSRFDFSGKPLVVALAGAALIGAASGALADRLLPAAAMPEARLTLVSNAGARAFDHIRAARQRIEAREAFEARQELAQARKLLAEARGAVPANRVQDRIAALLARIEDPNAKLKYTDVDPIYAEIEAAGGGDAYAATWRYVERARFQLWNQDRNAATRELLAASARVPYGRIDGPLGASYERVNQAMILLYDLDLAGADALLAAAEDNAHAVVQIASGAEIPMETSTPDVAAPAAPATAAPEIAPTPEIVPETPAIAPEAPATEIPASAEFQEPVTIQELPATAEQAIQEMTPALPDVAAPELTTPELPASAAEAATEATEASEATAAAAEAQAEAIEAQAEAIEDAAEAQAEAAEATAEAIEDAAEAQAEAVEAAAEAQVEAGQLTEEAAEAKTEAAEAAAEALEDAAEAQAEAADAAAEAIEDAAEAQAEAAEAAAEAIEDAAEAQAKAAAEAAEAQAEAAAEGAVQEMTPELPDVAAPPTPVIPSTKDIPAAAGEAAGEAVEGAVGDAIQELTPEAQP